MFLDQIVTNKLENFVKQDSSSKAALSFDSKFVLNASLTLTCILAIPLLLSFTILLFDWLQQPRFYFLNWLTVLFLCSSRVRDRLILATEAKTDLNVSPYNQVAASTNHQLAKLPQIKHVNQQYGTAQPRFFFRRPNAIVKRD